LPFSKKKNQKKQQNYFLWWFLKVTRTNNSGYFKCFLTSHKLKSRIQWARYWLWRKRDTFEGGWDGWWQSCPPQTSLELVITAFVRVNQQASCWGWLMANSQNPTSVPNHCPLFLHNTRKPLPSWSRL